MAAHAIAAPVATLLALSVLAGCVAPDPVLDIVMVGSAEGSGVPHVMTDIGGTGCTGAAGIFLISFADADPWLPPGYHPRDLSGMRLGAEVAYADKVPVYLLSYSCEGGTLSSEGFSRAVIALLVRSPIVDGVDDAADLDFYAVRYYSGDPGLQELWHELGADAAAMSVGLDIGEIRDEVAGAGPLRLLGATLESPPDAPDAFTVEVVAGVANRYDGQASFRFWHEVPGGTLYEEGRLPSDVYVGAVAGCKIGPGSVLAAVVGHVDCPDRPSIRNGKASQQQGIIAPLHDQPLQLVYLPGARTA